jgi:hypothetical protein
MAALAEWEVIVVGGGPAGMMAAARAAELGAKVILIEKNNSLGKKLLITGGGRCNVTNAELDNRRLLAKFKGSSDFLFSAFSQWSVKDTLNFFNTRGMPTKVEAELRVFPTSNSAQSVWAVLVNYLGQTGVTVRSNAEVKTLIKEGDKLMGVKLKNNEVIKAKNIIIATGGISRPETGSTGDAYKWLAELGHTITLPTPSLVPVALKDQWVKKLAGVTLNNIKLTVYQNEIKQNSLKGKLLFTHLGLSGPTVLNMSKDIGELLKYGEVTLTLDLLPEQDYAALNTTLQTLFKQHDKKNFNNALSELIPSALVPVIVTLSKIKPETKCHSITREDRLNLVKLLKAVPLTVSKLLGTDKAIITSGGVSLSEVDFKTMRSRLYSNLYLIGDILNIDRPSGGYSLQLCWTTGFVAGNSIKH